jgi:hypothetical protein
MPPVALPPGGAAGLTPAAARTAANFVPGTPATLREAQWTFERDSPVVTSLAFIDWLLPVAPARASAPRSVVVGAILLAARSPTDQELAALRLLSFLTNEMTVLAGSELLHELDKVSAFDTVYSTQSQWATKVPAFWDVMQDAEPMRLSSAWFYATEDYTGRNHVIPPELAFIQASSFGAIVAVHTRLAVDDGLERLSLATILLASKDTRTEREDEASILRMVVERLTGMLSAMHASVSSASGLAQAFASALGQLVLPKAFCRLQSTAIQALGEMEAAYDHQRGTSGQVKAVEQARVLLVGDEYPHLAPVLALFNSPAAAWTDLERLTSNLLPASSATISTLAKFSLLDEVLSTAAWSSFITHAINANPNLWGHDLVSSMLLSQADIAVTASAAGPQSPGLIGGGAGGGPFHGGGGSVRMTSLLDALRAKEASEALDEASSQSGVRRVETMMQSGSTILKRAELLQESSIQDKSSALAFCSLDAPYLCPYFAYGLTLDEDTDVVPTRLQRFVFDGDWLDTIRSGKWSNFPFLAVARDLQHLRSGSSFLMPKLLEQSTVAYCLNLTRDVLVPDA